MTAADNDQLIAAAREAVAAGEVTALEYWTAAAQTPGTGWQVSLPSYPHPSLPPLQGEGYNLPAGTPALRRPERPLQLTPDYGSPAVGGAAHHAMGSGTPAGMDGVAWPPGTTVSSVFPARTSSVQYVGASSRQTWRARLREAWSALLGR